RHEPFGLGAAVHRERVVAGLTADERRSALMLFADALASGAIDEADLDRSSVRRAVAARPVPPLPVRLVQRLALKKDALDGRRSALPLAAVREELLGAGAQAPPRFLVRVDEYPLAGAYERSAARDARFERF